ncbi:MAG: choice-of-anchor D domain-containing protein [Myxococcota bacterium]|nr:choice-of-anchor D domain-containing protein [Myxococcota bacterium]
MNLLLVLLSCTMTENNVEKIMDTDVEYPNIVVEPSTVDFGIVEPSLSETEVVTFRNDGAVALDITDVQLEGAAFTATSAAPIGLLPAGESAEMILSYSPQNLDDNGWLKVYSNDPDSPELFVPLEGHGAIPLLIIDPPELDMGWVSLGSSHEDGFTLRNGGEADLTISQTLLVGTEFELFDTPSLPVTLAPGEETWLDVRYTPPDFGEHTGSLWVESDTPSGNSQATVFGSCAPSPVAVCEVTPEEIFPHYETATWVGENSYDEAGGEITEYEWTLIERPPGSEAYIPNGGANRPHFSADLAGTYVGQLVVYNEWGRASEPCEASLEAIPRESLWVELYWEHSGDDMDLHIVRPNGQLETDNDCYYWNCVSGGWLDWGIFGLEDDDPSLDLDDITGTGPENTNILAPENGTFEVWVHDFPGSVYTSSNDVTVRIYLSGVLAWEGTKTISGENSYTRFAQVIWPDAVVVPD